ncbi:UDP-N-acetylmuramate--L-alanine ligase [Mongoliibacter ruber]|uniref:UDP-N-acetylmuramate--L-alanine ligase n=1 Tax=Mongoliibacter ruber TaxID=1750599 RepID=A0A2T0WJ14_9BACT|nr:UDP-N-acetylmuramate--L-alanine ligase [Mongoliibacter ruber]PRY86698.1 UDP-N-acetylmuramate--alanine ligase [Mongoliibacter ruber]
MNLKELHSVHFIGIGGIGMSALARWFNHVGVPVSGYDRTHSALTALLEAEGMEISFEDSEESIPDRVKDFTSNTLIVWTPAVPKDAVQLRFFQQNGYTLQKRAAVLGMITKEMPTIAVAGTHGKTTASSMIAHLLKHSGKNVAAFLGGVTQNYQSNLILHDEAKDVATVVVEADEFDRSFLQLFPNVAVVTSVDPDHLDIYGDDVHMVEGFREFVNLTSDKGKLYIQANALHKIGETKKSLKVIPYGVNGGKVKAANVRPRAASFFFDYEDEKQVIKDLQLMVPGFHNVENILPAISIALDMGITPKAIKEAVESYKGVKRRFEIWIQEEGRVYIDDYAHHPEEIRAFLSSVRAMYPQSRVTAIFQPHLFTRTRDFAKGFSESLSLADEVILLDIYPARELPIEGVTAGMLLEDIAIDKKSLQTKEGLLEYLNSNQPEVLVTIGAGDIDRLVEPIANWMRSYEN